MRRSSEQCFFTLSHLKRTGPSRRTQEVGLGEGDLAFQRGASKARLNERERNCFGASVVCDGEALAEIEVGRFGRDFVRAQGFKKAVEEDREGGKLAGIGGFEIELANELPTSGWHLTQQDEGALSLPEQHSILALALRCFLGSNQEALPVQPLHEWVRLGHDGTFEPGGGIGSAGLKKTAVPALRQDGGRLHDGSDEVSSFGYGDETEVGVLAKDLG